MNERRSLLVVDDTEAERELIALTLAAAFPGAEIQRADHPIMAQTMCAGHKFQCVLLDYNMPDMDGVSLARQLMVGDAYLPTILMTSIGDEMLAAEALRTGMSDYIPKSRITSESLRRVVDRSIHGCSQARLIDEQRGELENFAFALAHDFKQPIRQITTFAQLISEAIGADAGDEVQRHLAFLTTAASRLGKLVDVMSQYTLLNRPPKLADIGLDGVMASVRFSLAPLLAERGAHLVLPNDAPMVRGNEALMIQVLQNLIINGLLYNRSTVPRVELNIRRQADDWILEIGDNGLGIEAKYLSEIFKPLVRLHNSSEYPGSGLGLTLARKAVLAQHGDIWCESELGRGSIFHVKLPAARRRSRGETRPRRSGGTPGAHA
jgi:signal transduction histidine kinase